MSAVELIWGTPYESFIAEAAPMTLEHWSEVGSHRSVLRFNPNHDVYRALDRAGRLHILVARVDGQLAGYLFVITAPHPRDQQATLAKDDIFYAAPRYRRLRLGPLMIASALEYLRGRAVIVFFTEKLRRKNGGYLRRFGFEPQEQTWAKVLRNPHEELSA